MRERCPHCKQLLPTPKPKPARVCRKCHKPIEHYHKFRYVTILIRGTEFTVLEHRHCDYPEAYVKDKRGRV